MPLREFGPAPSVQLHFNLKVSFRWLPVLYLCGIVEVVFLSIKHGMMEEVHPSVCRKQLWRKRCSASLTCQQYFLVSYGYVTPQSQSLVYTRYIYVIFIAYTMYIQLKFSSYTVYIYLMYMPLHGISMVYVTVMLIHTVYLRYTWHIQDISN